MQKQAIVHIGTEKTGTTTLQRFLALNRELLKSKGIFFSKAAGERASNELVLSSYVPSHRDDKTKLLGINSNLKMISYQNTTRRAITDEIMSEDAPTALYSSELFQSRLISVHEIERLYEFLSSAGFDSIRVVLYIRDPAVTANSLYSTAVRCGSTLPAPPHPGERSYFRNVCNHRETIERWEAVFGYKNLIVKLYEKNDLVGGSIVPDFLSTIGVGLPESKWRNLPDQNRSLSALAIQLMRRINRDVPVFISGTRNPMRNNLVRYMSTLGGEPYRMPLELWKAYDREFEASNEWVRSRRFPYKDILFDSGKKPFARTRLEFEEHQLDQIAMLFTRLWADFHALRDRSNP